MISLLSIIAIGLALGMRHATDADHVIAVTTIVSREHRIRHAVLIGALWGVGHTLTICIVGAAIIVFKVVIPPGIGLAMELCVGLMLVLLGVLNLTGALKWVTVRLMPAWAEHSQIHPERAPSENSHRRFASDLAGSEGDGDKSLGWFDRNLGRLGIYQILRPLLVGIVHGLAGSAAITLLVLATIRNPYWGIAYLLVFGIGTIVGMIAVTAVVALPVTYTTMRLPRLNQSFVVASGLLSLGLGLLISYQIGIADGLFTSHPTWTPR